MIKVYLLLALLFAGACGCFHRAPTAPQPRSYDPALEVMTHAQSPETVPAAATPEKSWVDNVDNVDIDKIASSPWVIAGVFLLIQWFEIWYYNRTGRKSATIDAAEAAMQPKLGIVQRVLYWLWRRLYFWKNRDKKDPDKEEEAKKK